MLSGAVVVVVVVVGLRFLLLEPLLEVFRSKRNHTIRISSEELDQRGRFAK